MAQGKDIKTRFRIEAEAKGFEETERKAKRLGTALSPEKLSSGMARMEHHMKQMERQFSGLTRHLTSINQAMHRFGATIDKVAKLSDGLKKAGDGMKRVGDEVARTDQRAKRSAFVQGMIQGAGFGEFVPREGGIPAMGAQLAGRVTGGAIRAPVTMGRGLASSPFTGLQGLQTGLQGIPIVGGLAAGQLQAGAAAAEQALAVQQAQLGLAPHLVGGRGLTAAMARARARVMAEQMPQAPLMPLPEMTAEQRRRTHGAGLEDDLLRAANMRRAGQGLGAFTSEDAMQRMRRQNAEIDTKRRADFERDRASRAEAAAGAVRTRALGLSALRRQGMDLGAMDQVQSMQFAQQLLARGGGTLGGAQQQGAVAAAIAAQTRFGVGADISGSFLRAGRQGGIVGAQGRAGGALADALGDAMRAGFDESEAVEFLQQIAAGQQEFVRSGIPINPRSLAGLAQTMRLSGFQQGRAGAISGAISGRARMISEQGPQSAADVLLLQSLGGFRGGGLGALEQAQLRLEEGRFSGEDVMDFARTVSRGAGGGVAGRMSLRRAFGGMGARIGGREAMLLQKQIEGGTLTEDEQRRLSEIQAEVRETGMRGPQSLGDLQSQAAESVRTLASGLRNQASLQNQLADSGAKFVKIVQDLEQAQRSTLSAASTFAPDLEKLTGTIKDIAADLPKFAQALRDFIVAAPSWSRRP